MIFLDENSIVLKLSFRITLTSTLSFIFQSHPLPFTKELGFEASKISSGFTTGLNVHYLKPSNDFIISLSSLILTFFAFHFSSSSNEITSLYSC